MKSKFCKKIFYTPKVKSVARMDQHARKPVKCVVDSLYQKG